MNKLIIGSTALKHWFPTEVREPKDFDLISSEPKMEQAEQHYWIDEFQGLLQANKDSQYIDPDLLLTLKSSHFGWDIHWQKTANDILFLKRKGFRMNKDLYKSLVKGWIKVHGEKWAKLQDKDADKFFADAVKRKYVHDDIHDAVAVYDKPLYTLIKEREDSVKCLKDKFNQLNFNDQVLLVKEEVWVTALERYLIPSNFTFGDKLAYNKSLKKLTTTMSSGWFKEFIIDNFDHLYYCKDRSYIERFKQAERQNKLKLA